MRSKITELEWILSPEWRFASGQPPDLYYHPNRASNGGESLLAAPATEASTRFALEAALVRLPAPRRCRILGREELGDRLRHIQPLAY